MNRKYSALALSAVAMGAVVLTTTEASATKDPGAGPRLKLYRTLRPAGLTKEPATREPTPRALSPTTRTTTRSTK